MAERLDLPRVRPEGKPTIFNHGMAHGAFWGSIAGILVGSAAALLVGALFTNPALGVGLLIYSGKSIGEVIGGVIGGVKGKEKHERETVEGRVVRDPGYWNKGILSGLVVSNFLALPIEMAFGAFSPTFSMIFAISGMILGSSLRKNDLQQDFDRAVAIRENGIQQLRAAALEKGISQEKSMSQTVTKEEAAHLEEQFRSRNKNNKNFTENVLASRDLANAALSK
jgi:hypothetical protein